MIAQKPILLNANHFFVWHKMFVTATVSKFLVLHKKFGPAQNILGPVKGQAGNALERVQRVHEPADLWDITFCTR